MRYLESYNSFNESSSFFDIPLSTIDDSFSNLKDDGFKFQSSFLNVVDGFSLSIQRESYKGLSHSKEEEESHFSYSEIKGEVDHLVGYIKDNFKLVNIFFIDKNGEYGTIRENNSSIRKMHSNPASIIEILYDEKVFVQIYLKFKYIGK